MNEERSRLFSRSPVSRLFFAAFLIVAGTLLFLGNLGILPRFSIWSAWPLLIVALGTAKIINAGDMANRLLGLLITFFGVFFSLITLGIIQIRARDHSWPISMLLIALGMAMLIKMFEIRDPAKNKWAAFEPLRMGSMAGYTDFTVLSSLKRRLDSPDFRGAAALSVLGTVELDLRHARIVDPTQTIRLELSTILGEAKVRVPDYWHIRVLGSCILGSYENKTVPSNAPSDAPTLEITGYSILGAVEIVD